MDDVTDPVGGSTGDASERDLPPLPDRGAVEDFSITDAQRQAAVNHLDGEFARGVLDVTELERRKALAQVATTVAELLAATANEPATPVTAARPPRRNSPLLLVGVVVVGMLLVVSIVSKLG